MDSCMYLFDWDDKIMGKGIVPEGHYERIELYRERYSQGKDIFTGKPLPSIDYEQREKTEQRKAGAAIYGFTNKRVNNEVSS